MVFYPSTSHYSRCTRHRRSLRFQHKRPCQHKHARLRLRTPSIGSAPSSAPEDLSGLAAAAKSHCPKPPPFCLAQPRIGAPSLSVADLQAAINLSPASWSSTPHTCLAPRSLRPSSPARSRLVTPVQPLVASQRPRAGPDPLALPNSPSLQTTQVTRPRPWLPLHSLAFDRMLAVHLRACAFLWQGLRVLFPPRL